MLPFITTHGLPLLFLVVMLESFGVPLPGETALVGFAVLAAQHHYSIESIIVIAAVAAIIGDNLGYWLIGRVGGHKLLARWPWLDRRFNGVRPALERAMRQRGGIVVFFGRFIAILRFTAAWAAGLAGMPWWKFLFWNALGGIAWATLVGLIAYHGGRAAGEALSRYGAYAAFGIVGIGIAIWVGAHFIAKYLNKRILK